MTPRGGFENPQGFASLLPGGDSAADLASATLPKLLDPLDTSVTWSPTKGPPTTAGVLAYLREVPRRDFLDFVGSKSAAATTQNDDSSVSSEGCTSRRCQNSRSGSFSHGFRFQFREEGRGAGGNFASGEFVCEDRRLELHFRGSLGLVRYHVGDQSASHESYMRELGVWDQRHYPGFSEDPAAAFHDLAHDLGLAHDFLSGPATVLRTAAAKRKTWRLRVPRKCTWPTSWKRAGGL